MAASNAERVGRALELLRDGLQPFAEREFRGHYGAGWAQAVALPSGGRGSADDVSFLLNAMAARWQEVFREVLGRTERSYVGELSDVRNRWAHQEAFSGDDAYRALDTVHRFLQAVSAGEQATEVERIKRDLLRTRFSEEARATQRRVAAAPVAGEPAAGLKPWREVITPHPDVSRGTYQQAEFAADLHQVWRDEAADEYGRPEEFFRRTFLTEGLRTLLINAVRRWEAGGAGDPVVELQTNFGGGKTHSLIALFHLAGGYPPARLPGVEAMLAEAGLKPPERVNTAVLACQQIEPGKVHVKPDGTEVRTLWGELAWQLGEREGYDLVAEADRTATSPGASLVELFRRCGPCLVLVDEWVTYARQLYGGERLPAGTADVQFSFAQVLAEAARAVPGALVVVSIPSSDIEVGGEHGRDVLDRLKNVIGRMESSWRPATAEEGFEIVRRRLFEDLPADTARERDGVVRAFGSLYRSHRDQFPQASGEADYERRLTAAYPVHPELFDRLYGEWSALDKFQRTRGVLRLMAAVIHQLWIGEDRSLLIMPASVPIAAEPVAAELTRYLEGNWTPVIESDVDGPSALPMRLDRENPGAGRYSATRRVARTIYLGSAPTEHAPNRGIDDRSIKLGCVQPGEHPALFGDALRKLTERATYLYADRQRYWFSTVPSVTSLALGREHSHVGAESVDEEISKRLRSEAGRRGDLAAVHLASRPGDVPDEDRARLVVLGPSQGHARGDQESPAVQTARAILRSRGVGDRQFRNMLVFLAGDRAGIDALRQSARTLLAWRSIDEDRQKGILNLDDFQKSLIAKQLEDAEQRVVGQLGEAYQWMLVPSQRVDELQESWQALRLTGAGLYERASRKLVEDELLIPRYSGARLRRDLDGGAEAVPLWRGDHVGVRQIWQDYAVNLFLPRLRDAEVLRRAVCEGVGGLTWELDGFAYAAAFDEASGRYRGLIAGPNHPCDPLVDGSSVLVRPEVATRQLEAERPPTPASSTVAAGAAQSSGVTGSDVEPTREQLPRRFYGRKVVDPVRLVRDASDIAEAIVQQLRGTPGAEVKVVIEVEAQGEGGFGEDVRRTVGENARTLKFDEHEFSDGSS
jgi:predicted AAA+ superfamily ATPase